MYTHMFGGACLYVANLWGPADYSNDMGINQKRFFAIMCTAIGLFPQIMIAINLKKEDLNVYTEGALVTNLSMMCVLEAAHCERRTALQLLSGFFRSSATVHTANVTGDIEMQRMAQADGQVDAI